MECITVPCMPPFCVHQRYVWHSANGACTLLPHLHALHWHLRWATGAATDKLLSVDKFRPRMVIRRKEFLHLVQYAKDACGRLRYDKKLIEELDTETADGVHKMC